MVKEILSVIGFVTITSRFVKIGEKIGERKAYRKMAEDIRKDHERKFYEREERVYH